MRTSPIWWFGTCYRGSGLLVVLYLTRENETPSHRLRDDNILNTETERSGGERNVEALVGHQVEQPRKKCMHHQSRSRQFCGIIPRKDF